MAEPKEPETHGNDSIIITSGDAISVSSPKTYHLKPHNIRTFSDLQEVLETLDLRYIQWSGEDRAAKHPHLWEREE